MAKKRTVQKQEKSAQQHNVDKTLNKKNKKAPSKQQPLPLKHKQPKTKPIKKEEKTTKTAKQPAQQKPIEKQQKKAKAQRKQEQNLEVFTPEFYNRLNTFQTFYKQVLELKSTANNSDLSDELSSVNTRVRESLQVASSKILKDQLVGLQQWIEGERKRLIDQIGTIERCLTQNQKSLESTKSFTVDEIQSQLAPIRDRILQKNSTLENYATLLNRSRGIYGEAPQLQQEEKQQGVAQNNDQQDENDEDQDLQLNLE